MRIGSALVFMAMFTSSLVVIEATAAQSPADAPSQNWLKAARLH